MNFNSNRKPKKPFLNVFFFKLHFHLLFYNPSHKPIFSVVKMLKSKPKNSWNWVSTNEAQDKINFLNKTYMARNTFKQHRSWLSKWFTASCLSVESVSFNEAARTARRCSKWENTAARVLATKFGKTRGCGQQLPIPCTLKQKKKSLKQHNR